MSQLVSNLLHVSCLLCYNGVTVLWQNVCRSFRVVAQLLETGQMCVNNNHRHIQSAKLPLLCLTLSCFYMRRAVQGDSTC